MPVVAVIAVVVDGSRAINAKINVVCSHASKGGHCVLANPAYLATACCTSDEHWLSSHNAFKCRTLLFVQLNHVRKGCGLLLLFVTHRNMVAHPFDGNSECVC
jgi:hypothetical protein